MFVFNDPEHIIETCYNSEYDCVFVGTNVFPDEVYAGTSAKDKLTVAAVLAHEFYGHGPNRDLYEAVSMAAQRNEPVTLIRWKDEIRASLSAARYAPELTVVERAGLINDAIEVASKKGDVLIDGFMKGVLYPYGYDEKLQFFNERYYNSPDNVLRFAKIHKIKYKMPEMQAKPHHSHGR